MSKLPSLPGSIMSDFGRALQISLNDTLGPVQSELSASDEARDSIFRDTKSVIRNNAKIFFLVRTGETSQLNQLISENEQVLKRILGGVDNDQSLREGRLSQVIEKFTEARLLEQFFLTGRLASPASMAPADDEEYLGEYTVLVMILYWTLSYFVHHLSSGFSYSSGCYQVHRSALRRS
jgi:hypothetical protein